MRFKFALGSYLSVKFFADIDHFRPDSAKFEEEEKIMLIKILEVQSQ